MNNQPLISIITPTFNSQEFLVETLNSVSNQIYTNWEHIIVDDGSSDDTINIVKSYVEKDNRFKLIKRDRLPKGRSMSRNIGIENAQGKYIVFLDSDDLLYPHCLKERCRIMEENPLFNFCIFQMEMFLPSGEIKAELYTSESPSYFDEFLSMHWPWQTMGPIWKTNFLKDNNLFFDVHLSNLEDPLLHTQALLIDNRNFKVFFQKAFIDCKYRVDYKPVNQSNLIHSNIYFIKKIYPEIVKRKDFYKCKKFLHIYYTTFVTHYSGQSKLDLYSNIQAMIDFDKLFLEFGIITKKESQKTRLFLKLLKSRIFEKKWGLAILKQFGFSNFYCFTADKLINE